MNRRRALKLVGLGATAVVAGPAFTAPACGMSKEKAVRYTDIAIGYLKDVLPISAQLGGAELTALINKAIPALEKLKGALEDNEFPEAGNLFDQVTTILGQVANALFHLPDSPRRDQVIAILTLVNITLRTISLFVETEMPPAMVATAPASVRRAANPGVLRQAFEATRFK